MLSRSAFFKSQNISNTAKVLRLLKEKRAVRNTELNKICFRYGARIHELRHEGHIIVSVSEGSGLWTYHYMGLKPEEYADVD